VGAPALRPAGPRPAGVNGASKRCQSATTSVSDQRGDPAGYATTLTTSSNPRVNPSCTVVDVHPRRSGMDVVAQVPKPAHLATRAAGCWFEDGELKVHLGVDPMYASRSGRRRGERRRAVRTRSGSHIVRTHRTLRRASRPAFVGVPQHHGRPGCAAHSPGPARTRSSYLPGRARRRCSTSQQLRRCRRTAGRVTQSVPLPGRARPRAQSRSFVVRDR
jgi:hypothetical protein